MTQLHATAIAIDGLGVIIRGPSNSGKSDLALRLIDEGAELVADDRVDIEKNGTGLELSAPENLHGLIEVRGVGVAVIGAAQKAPLNLIVDLKPSQHIERMPEQGEESIEGISIPVVELDPFEASTVAKIKLALRIQSGKVTLVE
ncbi:MAG: hypothetical protein HN731_14510 [Rhodospirillaceae bacterium]|nr:hypothetical protein [Rhodospirillaceae bacterium]MBT5941901.1 hypothetical protein [Rhodospirillaceae bacterium]MBT7956400.1 hypothetical protein [Rhodospirillaceae bacterium]